MGFVRVAIVRSPGVSNGKISKLSGGSRSKGGESRDEWWEGVLLTGRGRRRLLWQLPEVLPGRGSRRPRQEGLLIRRRVSYSLRFASKGNIPPFEPPLIAIFPLDAYLFSTNHSLKLQWS